MASCPPPPHPQYFLNRPVWYDVNSVRIKTNWGSLPAHILDKTSLTRRMRRLCHNQFQVQLVSQQWLRPQRDEAAALNLKLRESAVIREVRLCCENSIWVYARSVIPQHSMYHKLQRLHYGHNKALGEILFSDRSMSRGPIEITCLFPGNVTFNRITASLPEKPSHIWGRRSLFKLAQFPLLVHEYFLPDTPFFGAS